MADDFGQVYINDPQSSMPDFTQFSPTPTPPMGDASTLFGGVANSLVPPTNTPGFFSQLGDTLSSGAKSFGQGVQTALSPFGEIAKGLSPLIGIGGLGVGIANTIQARNQAAQQNKIAERGLALQQESARNAAGAAAPLESFGSASLAKAQQGQIPPAMQAMIDQWVQSTKAKMHQYLASIGQGDSQTLQQMDASIDQQAVAMGAQMLQQEIAQGTGALTGAAGAFTGAGGTAGNVSRTGTGMENQLESLIFEANQQMARMTGSGG